ncbi:T9SS type A sorting domain-containing protein [Tamlana flava]|uniref:T9SS type A sorting domain-containing protein n=1 Tax=Tamlana flava TaxID=3158572 RepID=UPI00351AD4DE
MKEKLHVTTTKKHFYTYVSMFLLMISFGLTVNAQTLKHSWDFQTDTEDSVDPFMTTTVVGGAYIADGALQLDSNGAYLSFDGFQLDLNSYSAITMEYVFSSPNGQNPEWAWTSYFGNDDGYNALYNTCAMWNGEVWSNYNRETLKIANRQQGTNDGLKHHMVTVLSGTGLKMYLDGVEIFTEDAQPVTWADTFNIGVDLAYLGKGSDAWAADATWQGKIFEFNIYDGEMDAGTAAVRAAGYLDESNAKLASLSYSTGTLFPAFDSNITSYAILVDPGTPSVDIDGTTVVAGANITSGTGTITLTDDAGSTDVVVTAADGVTTQTYTITMNTDCYTPTYPTGNMVANPSMIGPFAAQTGFDEGWTLFDPKSDTEDACGSSFGSMYLKGSCYQQGGVLVWDSGVAIKPNTSYRILAKVKNETAASSDVFNFVLPNGSWDLEDTDSNGSTDQFLVGIPTGTGWQTFDQTIVSGPNAAGNVFFLIMSCDSADAGFETDFLYFDHFEVYDLSTLSTNDFEATTFRVFPNPSNGDSFKIAVNSFEGSVNVKVYSILGKEVLNKDFANAKTIEVNHELNAGLYIVKVNDKATAKLVVK